MLIFLTVAYRSDSVISRIVSHVSKPSSAKDCMYFCRPSRTKIGRKSVIKAVGQEIWEAEPPVVGLPVLPGRVKSRSDQAAFAAGFAYRVKFCTQYHGRLPWPDKTKEYIAICWIASARIAQGAGSCCTSLLSKPSDLESCDNRARCLRNDALLTVALAQYAPWPSSLQTGDARDFGGVP